ncbi:type IV toxin-antitoxin system AbiEi family antitoxin domain-containing protein [Advenella kashmirensis]|uniref:type IV toxin-antitoxin system AbiEi family antitoxin domain-containing protein n=1 Tax=Advenella kashmirensis TaxID=310575 RepID=UPI0004CE844D|nr:type IV toxin-antitoxin system AbiEi family antitoxin [Advenella kashmirensis]
MAVSRIQIAKSDILNALDQGVPVLKLSDLKMLLSNQRSFWRLAKSTTTQDFIEFLKKQGKLREYHFPFPHRKETRYVWGEQPLLNILQTLRPNSYFSHYTAMRMHGLTEQIPKTIYINHEQHLKSQSSGALEQTNIDTAFSRQPRISNNVIEFEGNRIYLLNGKNTGQLGVINEPMNDEEGQQVLVRVTGVERTLIDITVRPVYSGGVYEVLKAFTLAKEQVSVNALISMLKKINHIYPYHQAIGFYLERAGYRSSLLDLVRRLPIEYDFYLDNKMQDMEYVKAWQLYIPKGL